jgi:hypothetical protein
MHINAQNIEASNAEIASIYTQLITKLSISDAINDATAQSMISQKNSQGLYCLQAPRQPRTPDSPRTTYPKF